MISFWMAGPRINATFQYAVPKIKGVFINITAKKDFMNKAYCSCFATSLFQTNFLCVPMTMVFSHQKERRCKLGLQRLPFI